MALFAPVKDRDVGRPQDERIYCWVWVLGWQAPVKTTDIRALE
jgi:hypothetical protein